MSVDSKLLIKQVESKPALWHREDQHYCHKLIISKLWAEIAVVHGVHETKVRSKWKALRDTFRQELKKNPHKSSWTHYQDMQFLRGQFKTIPPRSERGFEDELNNMTIVKTEFEPTDNQEDFNGDTGCGSMDALPEGERELAKIDLDDDDYHFLMSLLPEMKRLEPQQKLLLRIKIMELFYKAVYNKKL